MGGCRRVHACPGKVGKAVTVTVQHNRLSLSLEMPGLGERDFDRLAGWRAAGCGFEKNLERGGGKISAGCNPLYCNCTLCQTMLKPTWGVSIKRWGLMLSPE